MNVLLLNPPADNEIIGNNPEIIEDERGYNPPLGLLYLAAFLEEYSDHQVEILDCQVEELSYPQLQKQLARKTFDVVGITAMSLTLIDVLETIKLVKTIKSSAQVVLGGPHAHLFPEETIELEGVDYLVLGEGEEAFKNLVDYLDDKEKLKTLKGFVFKHNGTIINTGMRDFIDDLDRLPFPARHLTPYQKYGSLLAKRTPVTIMMTSRGCPFQCTFCDRPQLGKRFRARSAKNVVDEMESCTTMGIHEFIVYDDTFTVNRQRAKDICDDIVQRKLDVGWEIRARVDTIDDDLLKKLKRANCRGIHYGVEAGTEKILKVLNKGITLPQVEAVFRKTKQVGITTLGYFMIGNPTETKDDILDTFEFSQRLDADFIHMTILTPFPGTKLYRDGLRDNIIDQDYWKLFAQKPRKDFVPPHWKENFPLEELQELLASGYKSFYTRPGYIVKRLAAVRSFGEMKRKVKAGLKVLMMK